MSRTRSRTPSAASRALRLKPLVRALQGSLFVLALGAAAIVQPVHAQTDTAQSADAATRAYNIAAGPLDVALDRFARVAGVNLSYDAALVQGLDTKGLNGTFSVPAGLEALLADTGLEAVRQSNGGYTLAKRTQPVPASAAAAAGTRETPLPEVRVDASADLLPTQLAPAYAGGQVATGTRLGAFGNRRIFDVPFSVTPFTRDVIDNQQARNMGDVVRNDASVTVMQGGNSAGSDESYNIRGFRTFGSVATYDGMPGLIGRSQQLEAMERVEILKGPSTFLNGTPSTTVGGVVNYVPKRAGEAPLTQLTTRYYSDSVLGAHADVSRRFGEDNRFGIRFNGALRDGDTPVDLTDKKNEMAALSLDFRGEKLRVSADFDYSRAFTGGRLGGTTIVAGIEVPDAPDNRNNWSQPWAEANQRKNRMLLRAELDFTPDWTFGVGYGRLDQKDANYVGCDPRIANAAGDVTISCNTGGTLNVATSAEANIRGRFRTGPVGHRLSAGVTRSDEESRNSFVNYAIPGSTGTSIYNPIYYPRPILPAAAFAGKTSAVVTESVYVADELGFFDDRLLVTLGGREVKVDAGNFDALTGERTSSYVESAFTPAVGVLYKVTPQASLYANYAEALEQSGVAPLTADNAGEVLPPLRSEQIEAGLKLDFGRLAATVGVFRITKANTLLVDNVFGVDGRQINKGVELSAFGEVAPGVRLLGSAMWIEAEQVRTANGTFDGNSAFSVPEFQATGGMEWDTPWIPGLTLSGNIAHTASAYVDAANTQQIPSWTRFDVGARYAFQMGRFPSIARLYVENVADADYWASVDRGSLYLSQPRTISLALTVNF